MSEEADLNSKLSKTQKKNKKRADKRFHERIEERKSHQSEPEEMIKQDPMDVLKGLLAEAKANKDHKLAAKLRQDLWVLQDACAGMNSELSAAEIDKTMCRISKIVQMSAAPQEETAAAAKQKDDISDTKTEVPQPEIHNGDDASISAPKQLRNLKKKLGQINKLKQKQEAGEVLGNEQIAKIANEMHVLEQIDSLQNKTSLIEILKNE